MNRGVNTPPSVKLLPVSASRFGLPLSSTCNVKLCARQFRNGLPTGVFLLTHGDPARVVVGTPSAAQLAARFGLAPICCASHGSVMFAKSTVAGVNRSFSVGARTDFE